jgi:NAD+-dependent protein deacetylase SIR2
MAIREVAKGDNAVLQELSSLVNKGRVIVITGAGISRSCGLPVSCHGCRCRRTFALTILVWQDFRSKDGIWSMKVDKVIEALIGPTRKEKGRIRIVKEAAHVRGKDLFEAAILSTLDTRAVFQQFTAALHKKIQSIEPSETHHWLRHMKDSGRLVRCYTQNIDNLESRVGLRTEWESEVEGATGDLGERCMVMQLHGSISSLRCTNPSCDYTSEWTNEVLAAALRGETALCPRCVSRNHDRYEQGKRQHSTGTLRPHILLYGESHPNDALLNASLEDDMKEEITAVLIMGTSLRIPGLQRVVRRLADTVHQQDGRIIFVNPKMPSTSSWEGVIDDCVQMESDEWVRYVRYGFGNDKNGTNPAHVEQRSGQDVPTGSENPMNVEELVMNGSDGMDVDPYARYEDRWMAAFSALEGRRSRKA